MHLLKLIMLFIANLGVSPSQVREKLARERAHLESIKERKLSELRSAGVPEKYVAELARMKI